MDLKAPRYAAFADLRVYCERVASAVGLASIEIFGYTNPATRGYAVELGLALQLTNILRDVATDAARGRLYLPQQDLARFGVGEADVMAVARGEAGQGPGLTALLAFEAGRAREHYGRAGALLPAEDRRSMVSAEVMGAIYRAILEQFARRGHPVTRERVGLSRPRKAWIVLRTLLETYTA
jgi:phytoene synthase